MSVVLKQPTLFLMGNLLYLVNESEETSKTWVEQRYVPFEKDLDGQDHE